MTSVGTALRLLEAEANNKASPSSQMERMRIHADDNDKQQLYCVSHSIFQRNS